VDFPLLETTRLQLRALSSDDANQIFTLFANEQVIAYYDLEAFTQPSQAQQLIELFQARHEQGLGIRWGIFLKDRNSLIGTCGFNSWSSKMHHAVLGYDLMPPYWGQGYATEAVTAILQAAFDGRLPCGPLHRIQADTVPGNTASEALLRRLGFQKEGLRRQSGYWKNAYHDLNCFGLLKSEFAAPVR